MFNFKKSSLVSVLLMGMAASAGANAASNATVLWSGIVPTTSPSDALIITGQSGDTTALNGTITPSSDGVFESDTILLEAHVNDGDAATPVVGELTDANWTLTAASVTFDGIANPSQAVEVDVNGEKVAVGGVVSNAKTFSAKVKQTAVLPEAEVGGATVQASITVMADLV
ncbi:hypothetical protein [Vibrio splendidus]|uniref:Fimbrial protein n=1 Tax=Vibrio splendidus 12E03 TaxID=1191305 RepID=A0A1E5FVT8_VIBSP|nr:hypothetical protein [Vibrio splendidus]OEF94283.1 hypothetical protein A142_17805 [Vibrio splendidus 12E03]